MQWAEGSNAGIDHGTFTRIVDPILKLRPAYSLTELSAMTLTQIKDIADAIADTEERAKRARGR